MAERRGETNHYKPRPKKRIRMDGKYALSQAFDGIKAPK
jgi:hypothetical protein